MRPIRTIASLTLGLIALAVADCQQPSNPATQRPHDHGRADPHHPRADHHHHHPDPPPHAVAHHPAPKPTPDSGSETIVGLWPVTTLAQAPVAVLGDPSREDLQACWELGAAMAAGLTLSAG